LARVASAPRKKVYECDAPFETPGEGILAWGEAERDVEAGVDGLAEAVAARTTHVALEQAAERAVHDAVALEERGAARAGVGRVKERDEALVGVLLRVPGQGPRGAPGGREEGGGAEWQLRRRGVGSGEKTIELAASAVLLVLAPARVVLVPEEVVPQEGVVEERLERRVEEARLAEVEQPAQALTGERGGVVQRGVVLLAWLP